MRVWFGLSLALVLPGLVRMEAQGRLTAPPWLMLLGNSSYAIYLVHNPLASLGARIVARFEALNAWPVSLALCAALGIGVGVLYHLLFEKTVLRRLGDGTSGTPSASLRIGHAFAGEQGALAGNAPTIARQGAVRAHHAMARDRHRKPVGAAGQRDGAHRGGGADGAGDVGIGRGRAQRDRPERRPDPLLEGGAADIEGQVETASRDLDEADHLRDPFGEGGIARRQRGTGKTLPELLRQRFGLVAEQDRTDSPLARRDENRPERAGRHRKADAGAEPTLAVGAGVMPSRSVAPA